MLLVCGRALDTYEAQKFLRESNWRSSFALFSHSWNSWTFCIFFDISKWILPIRDSSWSVKCWQWMSRPCASFMLLLANPIGPSSVVLIHPLVQSIDRGRNATELFVQRSDVKSQLRVMKMNLLPGMLNRFDNRSFCTEYTCAEYIIRGSELDGMTSFMTSILL